MQPRDGFDPSAVTRPAPVLLRYYLIIALFSTVGFPAVFLPLYFRYHTLRFRFDDEGISISWGILFRREVHLTYRRIQDIHVTRNLLQRWMGLATVEVQTASGNAAAEIKVEGVLEADVAIHLRYDNTWYLLSDRSLRIRRGIWTIRETTVTFENVQDVKIRQGPVERLFGIADVIVETAGGGGGKHGGADGSVPTHTGLIEGVTDAARIRDLIMDRVRRSRSAGLGDEPRETRSADRSPGRSWTPEHMAALREIRDALTQVRNAG